MTAAPHFESTIDALAGIEGLEVHYYDHASGRIIVTQESANVSAEITGLQHIKSLPHVILAEMVYHYCEDEEEQPLIPIVHESA